MLQALPFYSVNRCPTISEIRTNLIEILCAPALASLDHCGAAAKPGMTVGLHHLGTRSPN
ncbi:MAG: hypothetical protein JWR22_4212 [Herminiimonas sp.]|nr:hypothetical protein [Herminiimonas sp.]